MKWILIALLCMVGCTPRNGPIASVNAPAYPSLFEDRRSLYTRLQAEGGIRTYDGSNFFRSVEPRKFIQLADGTKVWEPDDLSGVLNPSSPTAVEIRKLQKARNKRPLGYALFVAGWLIGGGVLASGILMVANADKPEAAGPKGTASGTVVIVAGGAGLVSGVGYGLHLLIDGGREVRATRIRAFERYNESLAGTLGICTRGIELTDCDVGR